MENTKSDNNQQNNKKIRKTQPFLKGLVQILGYGAFATINVLRFPYFTLKKKAVKNRAINQTRRLSFPLNGQSMGELKDMRIGSHNFAHSGCGAIATFNALSMAGLEPRIEEIVDFYERKGLILNAGFGVNPVAVKKYLTNTGLNLTCYKGKQKWDDCLQKEQAAIMLYLWVGPKGMGAHYVSMEKSSQGVRVYNVYGNRDVTYEFEDIQAFLDSGKYKRVVSMFVIDKKVN